MAALPALAAEDLMVCPTSFPISLSQVQAEFGGTYSLLRYRRGDLIESQDVGASIPTTASPVSLSNFLSAYRRPRQPTIVTNSGSAYRNFPLTMTGTGRPGDFIALYRTGDYTTGYGSATVDGAGNWSAYMAAGPPNGVYNIIAMAFWPNTSGLASAESADAFSFILDTVPPSAPFVNASTGVNNAAGYSVTVSGITEWGFVKLYRGGTYYATSAYTGTDVTFSGITGTNGTTYYFTATLTDDAGNESSQSTPSKGYYVGPSALAATIAPAAPTTLDGFTNAQTGAYYSTSPTAYATVSPTGGTPPYTYAWSKTGDALILIDGAPRTVATCRARVDNLTNILRTGRFTCVVTDSATPTPATVSVYVDVTMERAL
jgi:hypothetical protein